MKVSNKRKVRNIQKYNKTYLNICKRKINLLILHKWLLKVHKSKELILFSHNQDKIQKQVQIYFCFKIVLKFLKFQILLITHKEIKKNLVKIKLIGFK